MRYAFFLGCLVPNYCPEIELATRDLFSRLGIELLDLEGASCCPSPSFSKSIDEDLWLIIGARNISLAEKLRADIVVVCNGCYDTLHSVNKILKENDVRRG